MLAALPGGEATSAPQDDSPPAKRRRPVYEPDDAPLELPAAPPAPAAAGDDDAVMRSSSPRSVTAIDLEPPGLTSESPAGFLKPKPHEPVAAAETVVLGPPQNTPCALGES